MQADWQEVWHSPQPPFFTVFCSLFVFNVFTCFMRLTPFLIFAFASIPYIRKERNSLFLFVYRLFYSKISHFCSHVLPSENETGRLPTAARKAYRRQYFHLQKSRVKGTKYRGSASTEIERLSPGLCHISGISPTPIPRSERPR